MSGALLGRTSAQRASPYWRYCKALRRLDAGPVARLWRRRSRLCFRSLRDLGAATHCPSGTCCSREFQARHCERKSVGGTVVLCAIGRGRYFWTPGRLPDRSVGAPACVGVEHPALCLLGLCRQLCSYAATVVGLPLYHCHRRVCGICGGSSLGGRAVLESQAASICAGLYAGCLRPGRTNGNRGLLRCRHLRGKTPGHTREARGLALYAALRAVPGDCPHPYTAILTGISNMARKEIP